MSEIVFLDRESKEKLTEKVYGSGYLSFLYGKNPIGKPFCQLICRIPFFSMFYGFLQNRGFSKKNVLPFIEKFGIDASEFLDPPESFATFNAFFTRKLKGEARPIVGGDEKAIIPADGRYLVFPNLDEVEAIHVKGQKLSLAELLGDEALAKSYSRGGLVIARLAPVDYHRFHFPVACTPSAPREIKGPLFSVNPIALRKKIAILSENKRTISRLETVSFGEVLFIEVGATYVGTIHQTYKARQPVAKGEEKGFFSFGGSSLILLFEPGRIQFDVDLVEASRGGVETLCKMGQSLGVRS